MKKRNEIEQKYKWDIESMYPDEAQWEEDYKEVEKMTSAFKEYKNTLADSADNLLNAFEDRDRIWHRLEKMYVYSRMKRDEDNTNAKYQALNDKVQTLMAKISSEISFFTPELLNIDQTRIDDFLREEKDLALYSFAINKIFREKEHILDEDREALMAQMSEITSATNDIFTMMNNADMKFGTIKGPDGEDTQLTHGNYIKFLESKDRDVRRSAFQAMYKPYTDYRNTLATSYAYNTKTDVVVSRIRSYPSSLEAALSGDNVDRAVYENLINTVNDYLPVLHKYMGLRKKVLELNQLHMYDVYVPLFEDPFKKISYRDGLEMMKEGLNPLGSQYISDLTKGVEDGWIDVYENEGKTSGAYSFGSYDSKPFVLLNYTDTLKDVFTLVHEMGHSMHSFYTRKTQPYIYGGHSIFTAEVASTVNESLLINHLIEKAESEEEKKFLINLHIEDFRTTLFRQTMFAEFEKFTHEEVERGGALTADVLSEEYGKLNKKYFGDKQFMDSEIFMEWARIPHFYRAFYVYKYATGYSAATAISNMILNGGDAERKAYLDFLKSGDSNDPIELLKIAGIDMAKKDAIESAMEEFTSLVERLEGLI